MSRAVRSALLVLLAFCALRPLPGFAQGVVGLPAHVTRVEGAATLTRDGRSEAVRPSLQLFEGDRLATRTGRLDVILPDGSSFALDHATTIELLSDATLALASGRLAFVVSPRSARSGLVYHVGTLVADVKFGTEGEYRLRTETVGRRVDLAVEVPRGLAVLAAGLDTVTVRSGEEIAASAGVRPGQPRPLRLTPSPFDAWRTAAAVAPAPERQRERDRGLDADYDPGPLGQQPGQPPVTARVITPPWTPNPFSPRARAKQPSAGPGEAGQPGGARAGAGQAPLPPTPGLASPGGPGVQGQNPQQEPGAKQGQQGQGASQARPEPNAKPAQPRSGAKPGKGQGTKPAPKEGAVRDPKNPG